MSRNPKRDPRPGDILAYGRRDSPSRRVEVVRVEPAGASQDTFGWSRQAEVYWRGLLGTTDGGCDLSWWTETARYWRVERVAGEVHAEQGRLL